MTDGSVVWRFFDAESGHIPDDFSPSILPGGGAGRIVALAATPLARLEGWASRAVVAIAKEWARQDLRIFLMDLGLDAPSLHEILGLANGEGVSDAFLYGASVQRIAQPALDDTIFFASAGTKATDPEQILGHPRWNDLAGGFSEADATLLLFLPTEIPGAEKIMSRATDILFLAGQGESPESHLGPASVKVAAILGPMRPSPETELDSGPEADVPSEDPDPLAGGLFGLAGDLLPDEDGSDGVSAGRFERTLSLAEGFSREVEDARTPAEAGGDEPGGYAEEGPFPGPDGPPPDPTPFAAPEADGGLEAESSEGDERAPGEPPDFGAEFATMPSLEYEDLSGAPQETIAGDSRPDSETESDWEARPQPEDGESVPTSGGESPLPPARGPVFTPERAKPLSRRRPPPKKKLTRPVMAGMATAVIILLAAGGTALGFFSVPGLTWLQGRFAEVPYPELVTGGAEPVEPVLRFSLELETYESGELGVAIEMRDALRSRLPELVFSLTPFTSDGVVSYVLLAGPAIDMVEAENLRGPLAEVMTREDPESWPVRSTPRAFLLGTEATRSEAEAFLAEAERAGAVGYVLQVTYPDGAVGYQILSGAFQGTQDARSWQLALRDAGFRDVPLVERRGRPPA